MPRIHLDGRVVSSRNLVCNHCPSQLSISSSLAVKGNQNGRVDLRTMLEILERVGRELGWKIDPGTGRGACPIHVEELHL